MTFIDALFGPLYTHDIMQTALMFIYDYTILHDVKSQLPGNSVVHLATLFIAIKGSFTTCQDKMMFMTSPTCLYIATKSDFVHTWFMLIQIRSYLLTA